MLRKKIIMIAVWLFACFSMAGFTEAPYEGYYYNSWGEPVGAPNSYVPTACVGGNALGAGLMNKPSDLFVKNDRIYVVDSGNNRVVALSPDMQLLQVISSFQNNGTEEHFKNPQGIFVAESGLIYVADTDNHRVVVLDKDKKMVRAIGKPASEQFDQTTDFLPTKIGVDFAGRIFVAARNVMQGIMTFDKDGVFTGYFGMINVEVSPAEVIWRRFMTKEQRSKDKQFIPTEFTNIDVDKDGFVFATNLDQSGTKMIKRFNTKGNDVLKSYANYNVAGDLMVRTQGTLSGVSEFVDIAVRENGIYSALDRAKGRIFTYNSEGRLLHIFGTLGTQDGTFSQPAALAYVEDNILVLDGERGQINVFSPTKYGALITRAIILQQQGKAEAETLWNQVLAMDTNNELAYVGIGKAKLVKGENREAMECFKMGMDQRFYSVAFKRYRTELLKKYFSKALTVLAFLVIALISIRFIRRRRKRGKAE